MFDESLRDVFSALCKDIQKRLRGRGAELKDEELLLLKFYIIVLLVLLSPSGDLGIGLVWHNLSPLDPTPPPQLFGPTVEILFKLN